MIVDATNVKTAYATFSKHRSRVRFYGAIAPSDDQDHPVDAVVQRWARHEQQRTVSLQHRILADLAPDARGAFLELEELRNTVAAEREEAYFDLGMAAGIERERRRWGRLQKLSPAVSRLAARIRRSIERESLEEDEAVLALVEVLAEHATSVTEFRAEGRKTR